MFFLIYTPRPHGVVALSALVGKAGQVAGARLELLDFTGSELHHRHPHMNRRSAGTGLGMHLGGEIKVWERRAILASFAGACGHYSSCFAVWVF